MIKHITLEKLINELNIIDEELCLILPSDNDLSLQTNCLLLSNEEIDDNMPQGYCYAFGIYNLVDIIENLKIQTNNDFDSHQLIRAINHYIDNDAFIEL